jgi:hypothetical protein
MIQNWEGKLAHAPVAWSPVHHPSTKRNVLSFETRITIAHRVPSKTWSLPLLTKVSQNCTDSVKVYEKKRTPILSCRLLDASCQGSRVHIPRLRICRCRGLADHDFLEWDLRVGVDLKDRGLRIVGGVGLVQQVIARRVFTRGWDAALYR